MRVIFCLAFIIIDKEKREGIGGGLRWRKKES